MILSRMVAGVCQSMRRSTRKPRLNHDTSRWRRSLSTGSTEGSPAAIRSRRMATISAVAPGAKFRRRKNSSRGLSTARCRALMEAVLDPSRNALAARVTLSASGCMVRARNLMNASRSGIESVLYRCRISRAMATPEASPRLETNADANSWMSSTRPAPPSDRGRYWRPCSATEFSSSWRKETFIRLAMRRTASMV